MTKRWNSTVSDLGKTKRQASKEARRNVDYEDDPRKDCPWKCKWDDPKCLCGNGE